MPNPVNHMTPYPSNHLAMVPNPQNFNLPDTQLNYGRELRFLGGDKLGLVSEYLDDSMRVRPGIGGEPLRGGAGRLRVSRAAAQASKDALADQDQLPGRRAGAR